MTYEFMSQQQNTHTHTEKNFDKVYLVYKFLNTPADVL